MPSHQENLQTAKQLTELLDTMKSIHGTKWKDIVAEQQPLIERLMIQQGHRNPLQAIIPVVKQMHADGTCPFLVLAVATEMSATKR